jgi:hypothetical protein
MAAAIALLATTVNAFDWNMQLAGGSDTPGSIPTNRRDRAVGAGAGQGKEGVGIVNFITAVGVAVIIFIVQVLLFALFRNKQTRI